MENKQTALTLLFQEFKALSEAMRKADDEQSANLIDFLCEREDVAKQMEREQIEDAFQEGKWDWQAHICNGTPSTDLAQYYNETYGGQDE
jgi:hypothetical protein